MRHHNSVRKFGRESNQRLALIRSLAKNLILNGRIMTTVARAKEVRPFVEKLVTKSRTDSLATRRYLVSHLALGDDAEPMTKLMTDLAPKYKERAGGYTRIVKVNARKGDASPMAVIEFV